ncbi:MAG TPA: UDP-3-O-acyl-N-acetylglucosamine deacetylase [Pirellulales bacterium]|jgi:UDP-3-O-acyl N-acetylglucosamine deacetylase|nr:UDP-3-O-acyl-N-acetylglucosamine deacetylase [Pirellulales bacterium]
MHASRKQRTLAGRAMVAGYGYWSGRDVRVEFRPAAAGSGVTFVRTIDGAAVRIPASVLHRVESPRRTNLAVKGASVEMVEHVLAALAGLKIDNCDVHVDQPEMPGCDGSCQAFVDALDAAGIVEQDAVRPQLIVREVTRLGDDDHWIEARPHQNGMAVKFRLDYGAGNAIGRQTLQLPVTPDSFRREIAPARTFLLKEEADWLLAQGMGKRTTPQDLLIFDAHGPIENELRFADECVRHKVLDLIGDLSLAGCDLVGHFIAHRSGHRLNADMVRVLLNEAERVEVRRKSA